MATSQDYEAGGIEEKNPMIKDTQQKPSIVRTDPPRPSKAPRPPKRKGCCAPCGWYWEKPCDRWQFGVFLLWPIFCVFWAAVRFTSSGPAGDILAGIFALILAVYGANHFRILLGLKEQVDTYANNNKEFKQTNVQLTIEVNRLNRAISELDAAQQSLVETSQAFAENIEKFKRVQTTLSKLSEDNIEGVKKLKEMSYHVNQSIRNELIQHERSIIYKVKESLELNEKQKGLTKKDYETFVGRLPGSFQLRFRGMEKTWEEIAGTDGILHDQEFADLCDKFADEEASAGGTVIDPLRMSRLESFHCKTC